MYKFAIIMIEMKIIYRGINMKKFLKVVLKLLCLFLVVLSLFTMFAFVSPYPTTWAVRALFSMTTYTDHENLAETKEEVTILSDVTYPSQFKSNKLDILYPTDYKERMPVIFWVHGGAFVAGSKSDVTNYMIMLANEGFVIVNIEYELAPNANYPAQIIQVGEAYQYIENSIDYPFINKDLIYFGGDSAGAHIAAQFITIQTNPNYLNILNQIEQTKDVKKVVNKEIKGAILFAGPYDFMELSNLVKSRVDSNEKSFLGSVISFFAKRIGLAYLGKLDWKNDDEYKVLSIVDYVDENFPQTFITDGRKISFEDHAKKLENILKGHNVEVTSVYYDYDLMHEYQFNLGTISEDGKNYAQMTFELLVDYLNK